MAKKKPPPPPPSPSPKTLPPRKAIHTLTASDQPKNQSPLTAFFGIGSSAPPRPIIADEPESPIIVISSDDDEEGRRALPTDQQQRPVAQMPINASQRHSPRPRRQPRPRTFGDFVPSSGSGESSSDSEKRRRIFEETKKSLDSLVTPDESRPSSSSNSIQRPSTSGSSSNSIQRPSTSGSGSNSIQRPSTSGNVTPPPYYGSEWDTDGDATLKQRKKVAAKKRPAPAPEPDSNSDSDFEPKKKQRKPANVNIKNVAAKKRPAPAPESDSNSDSDCEPATSEAYRALIRTSESRISFLGHEMTKQSTKFLCPYVDQQNRKCKRDFTTYSALQKHFQNEHKLEKTALLKPVDTAPNNWRRIQNDNKRFRLSTVKLKLCSLLVGGKSVVAANRQRVLDERNEVQQPPSASSPTQLQKQQNEMAQEVFEIIQQQAAELSKLAILFSHLVYFKIYRLINTNDERVADMAFQQNINWNLILLTFKQFLRATKNATIPNAKTTQSDNNTSLYTICATDFFDLCHEFDVGTSFEQWSQNAWNYIADTFQTNFRNNIMVHLYQRLRNWFYFRLRNGRTKRDVRGKENRKKFGDKVYHTMKFLFYDEKCTKPELVQHKLIAELQAICKFPDFNKSGQSYFSRLYHDESDCKPSQPKKAKLTRTKKSKQNNGPRLLWLQMVPGFVRLQKWIHATNLNRHEQLRAAGILKPKTKRKRKRKRKRKSSDPKTAVEVAVEHPVNRPHRKRRQKRKHRNRQQDDDALHYEKLRNFIVVPQHSFAMKHFAIDTKSLFDIAKNLKAFHSKDGKILFTQNEFVELGSASEDANVKTMNPFWFYLFNLKKLETVTKKFGGRITTNSSDVSVQLCKVIDKKRMSREEVLDRANRKRKASDPESDVESESEINTEEDDHQRLREFMRSVSSLEDVTVSGVDLGIRNVAATVLRAWNNTGDINESNVLHKSKDYHYNAGFSKRQRKRRKILGAFDDAYQKDRQSAGDEPSNKSPEYMTYIRSRLKWFNDGTAAYMKRQVYNMNFEKFTMTQKQMTKMAQEIVGDVNVHQSKSMPPCNPKKFHVVFVGDCSTPANSPVKGHRRSPGDKPIIRFLKQRPNTIVLKQDEFRTTRNCSRCFEELDTVESSKDRLKICKKNCKPAEDSMTATEVSTYTNKQHIRWQMEKVAIPKPTQTERQQRVNMNRFARWTVTDKIRMEERRNMASTRYQRDPSAEQPNILWNRDINAARNIIYLGLCQYGAHLDNKFRNLVKNTAFSRPSRPE